MPRLKKWAVGAGLALGWIGNVGAMAQATSRAGSSAGMVSRPQLIPRTHEERERRFLAQHRIVLNVELVNAAGKTEADLGQADFTLFDNELPQKVIAFAPVSGESVTPSPHVIVVVDAVNNFGRHLHFLERDLQDYLKKEVGPLPYPFAIGVLRETGIDISDSTRDRKVLSEELSERTAHLDGSGCIADQERGDVIDPSRMYTSGRVRDERPAELECQNQRFVQSVTALGELAKMQVDVPGRVILIWMGSGWPLLTNKLFKPDPPDIKQNNFAWLVSLSNSLREAQITLDAAESPDDTSSAETYVRGADFYDGVKAEDQMKAGYLGLHALAHQTGGRVLTDTRDLPGEIRSCLADVNSYYVLKFDSPMAAEFGEFHSLAVKVDKPGIGVRTNAFYYAEQ